MTPMGKRCDLEKTQDEEFIGVTTEDIIIASLELKIRRMDLGLREYARLLKEEKIKSGRRGHDLKIMRAKLSGRKGKKV